MDFSSGGPISHASWGGPLYRSIARALAREGAKQLRRQATYGQVMYEAMRRPDSECVSTPSGTFWMSPIEVKLYEAMRAEGLCPIPQYPIEGYIADFAFPDIRLAIEADGVAYHSGPRKERDRKRDWILGRHGWTVKRFYGTTIHDRAGNCAYVVKREVESRRLHAEAIARQREKEREVFWDELLGPFRAVKRRLFTDKKD